MKKFLVGVGNVVAMQGDSVVFEGKTMLNTGIEVSTSNTEIRGGQGNQLQAIYYHSGAFSATITDTQWSLQLIALNTGAKVAVGGDIWATESVEINGNSGTLEGTPIPVSGSSVAMVHFEYNDTLVNRVATGKTFETEGIPDGTTLCVSYLKNEPNAKQIVISANIVPDRVRLFITANLSGDTTGSGFIGTATVEIPIFQLSGGQSITMNADGYSETPLEGMALAYADTSAGCTNGAYYAKITEHIDNALWYTGVSALAIEGGDFTLNGAGAKKTLQVWAIKNGMSFIAPNSGLTFTSGTEDTATVGENTGLVTAVANGTSLIKVVITGAEDIEAKATVTVEGV